jgi:hypothetical protein
MHVREFLAPFENNKKKTALNTQDFVTNKNNIVCTNTILHIPKTAGISIKQRFQFFTFLPFDASSNIGVDQGHEIIYTQKKRQRSCTSVLLVDY